MNTIEACVLSSFVSLSEDCIFTYLVDRGYCKSNDVIQEIRSLPGRNHNFRVKCSDHQDWIVKQEVRDQHGCDEIFLTEWAVQLLLSKSDRLKPLREFIPPVLHYDRPNSILISQFLPQHQDLSNYYGDWENEFDPAIAHTLGHNLGLLHCLTFDQESDRNQLTEIAPNFIQYCCPSDVAPIDRFTPEMLGWIRSDALTFFKWYQQQPDLNKALTLLEQQWRSCCLVHQDLRLENWLFDPTAQDLQLIDWERSGWGDPDTDIANVLCAYLKLWLETVPSSGTWQARLEEAELPLEQIKPSLNALMSGYFRAFPERNHPETIRRILQWTGRQLIYLVQIQIQYHRPIASTEAAFLHIAQKLILYPEVLCLLLFDHSYSAIPV